MTRPTPPVSVPITVDQVREMPADELGPAIIAAARDDDRSRRGAAYLLVEYGDFSLLRFAWVRSAYVTATEDGPLINWSRLAQHLRHARADDFDPTHLAADDPRRWLGGINGSALDALTLAASLGSSNADATVNLHGMASRLGIRNRATFAEAIAIAFGAAGTAAEPGA